MTLRTAALLLAAAVALVGLGGCSPAAPPPDPVVLRIAAAGDAASTPRRQADHLAREVRRLSRGALVVRRAAAGDVTADDRAAADLVLSGRAALGLVRTRVWDEHGVTTLRALNTPFLITTDAQLRRAVTGPAAAPMLAGLRSTAVTGLALLPASLQHPFGVGEPLLWASEYDGRVLRTTPSATAGSLLTALGARPTDAEDDPAVRGAESSYPLAPHGSVATGNVVFFPDVTVLVADATALAKLPVAQRRVLRVAAARTRTWAVRTLVADTAAASAFCDAGGSVALASDAQVASLEAAAEPVRRSLERDAATARIIRLLEHGIGTADPVREIPLGCSFVRP